MSINNSDLEKEFFEAAKNNDLEKVVKLVKEKGVDVNSRDHSNDNSTALHLAAYCGHFNLVKTLVEELNADINIENVGGEVPMHIAGNAESRNLDIVRYLYEKGSDYAEDIVGLLDLNH